jgi:hypothetical protein
MSRFPSIAVLVLAAAPALAASEPARPVLPFIENDYPRALSEARAKKLPIFAEAWAPW